MIDDQNQRLRRSFTPQFQDDTMRGQISEAMMEEEEDLDPRIRTVGNQTDTPNISSM